MQISGPPRVMTDYECAIGWLLGAAPLRPQHSVGRPLGVREAVIDYFAQLATASAPTYIAFSGGVDSSFLLALASEAAQNMGVEQPVPVTVVFDDDHPAGESAWQRAVLEKLGLLARWQQVTLDPADDLVGPHALPYLRRHGVCWPNAHLVNFRATCAALPAGARLVTGDGGDEAFGPRRVTALAALARRHPLNRARAIGVARGLAPRPLRRWDQLRMNRRSTLAMAWLRPSVQDSFAAGLSEDLIAEPLQHAGSTRYWMQRNAVQVAASNMSLLAADYGVELHVPLVSESVTAALQAEGRLLGWLSRAEIVQRTAGDLLPEAITNRVSKAVFNTVMFGRSAREIVGAWDGSGIDDRLVDAEQLRAELLSDMPDAGTGALLQQIALQVVA